MAAAAYDPTKPYPAYTAPRLAIGQPDLQGFWSNATLTNTTRSSELGERLAYTEEEAARIETARIAEVTASTKRVDVSAVERALGPGEAYNDYWKDPGYKLMRVNGQPRTSVLTTPNGRAPAAKPGAVAAQTPSQPGFFKLLGDSPIPRGAAYDNPESSGLGERCIIGFGRNGGPPMLANGFSNNNYQIVQSPGAVVIVSEMIHDARIVRLNSRHRTDDVRPYFGDSIGRWEGDTLVVETTNIPQSQAYMGAWKNLKVTERFRRVAGDRLLYAFQIEDKSIWDEAWGGEYEFSLLKGQRVYEYACHEGNHSLHGILAGARVQDAKSGAKR
ncbi:MAG TPA: hypothetical protein VGO52_26420 [Hyphomonadaceae bacterium]|jgi:hypothetical protein|nr:hypothetical protein [Hyphomonadaceae bacterium]